MCEGVWGHVLYGDNFSSTHSLYNAYKDTLYFNYAYVNPDVTRFKKKRRSSINLSSRGYPPISNIYTNNNNSFLISQFTATQVLEIQDAIRLITRYITTYNTTLQMNIGIFKAQNSNPNYLGEAWRFNNTHGQMNLFTDNIPPNILFAVTVHELLHILGFGSTERWQRFIDDSNNFVGPLALVYINKLGQSTLPLETGYNASESDLVHWAAVGLLQNDIMAASISDPTFSAVSFAALNDAVPDWTVLACINNNDCTDSICVDVPELPSLCTHNPMHSSSIQKPSFLLAIASIIGSFVYIIIYLKCNNAIKYQT